jgi:hypothetical protein
MQSIMQCVMAGWQRRDSPGAREPGRKGSSMRKLIRVGAVLASLLSLTGAARVVAGDAPEGTGTAEVKVESPQAVEPSKDVFEPGAASVEPQQSIEENGAGKSHHDWVESIWNTP